MTIFSGALPLMAGCTLWEGSGVSNARLDFIIQQSIHANLYVDIFNYRNLLVINARVNKKDMNFMASSLTFAV